MGFRETEPRAVRRFSRFLTCQAIQKDDVAYYLLPQGGGALILATALFYGGNAVAERRKNRAHSTLDQLPAEVQAAIEARLHDGDTYQDITDQLNRLGHDVSRAAVARWGKRASERKARLEASADLARVLTEKLGPEQLEGAATVLALDLVVNTLMEHEDLATDEGLYLPHVTALISALARVSSTNLAKEKFKADIERKAQEAAAAVAGEAREGGLSESTIELIKSKILGISADVT